MNAVLEILLGAMIAWIVMLATAFAIVRAIDGNN